MHYQEKSAHLWPWLLLCAVGALLIDLGTIHRNQQADSLIQVLNSLYCWTPYYWGENRFGMLVPLLAHPIKHPLVNLLFQDALLIFAGLAVFFLLPRYLVPDSVWPEIGALSATAFLALAPTRYQFGYFVDQCYSLSLALALGGLALLEGAGMDQIKKWRVSSALILIILAHWVNVGVVLILGPLIVLRTLLLSGSKTEAVLSLLIGTIGFLVGVEGMDLSPVRKTSLASVPVSDWPNAWLVFATNTWAGLSPHYWPQCLLLAVVIGLVMVLCVPVLAKGIGRIERAGAVLMLASIFYGLFAGTREWVAGHGYADRYAIPSVILFQSALAGFAALPVSACLRRFNITALVFFAPALPLACVYSYGTPSLTTARADLDRKFGDRTADVLEGHCSHVAGEYWAIWPMIFHVNLVRYEQGDEGVVWGISSRSAPSLELLRQVPFDQVRIAVPINDPNAESYFRLFQFPALEAFESRATIDILVPKGMDKLEECFDRARSR